MKSTSSMLLQMANTLIQSTRVGGISAGNRHCLFTSHFG